MIDYPNRTMCAVLDEMRACFKTHNYTPIPGLIEEIQSMGNKMEASLSDKDDVKSWSEQRSKLKQEINKLEQKVEKLKREQRRQKSDD